MPAQWKGKLFMYTLCFVLVLIAPVLMFAIGVYWWVKAPAFGSRGIVYRTALTEKSEEVWYFAHLHCGKLWARFGFFLIVIAVVLMLVFKERYTGFLLWLLGAEMLVLCGCIVLIDVFVKNLFDENGVRIR